MNIDRTIAIALENIRPGCKWIMHDYNYDKLEWFAENIQNKPSRVELDSEIERIKKKDYIEKRASEYPSIGDQLDALFKAGVFPEEMAAQIQAVKEKYPKG